MTRIVDRYLEHARVFVFHNDGDPVYFMGSADWMNRNLHSRIEVCFRVEDPRLKSEIATILEFQLKDNCKAGYLTSALENNRIMSEGPRFQAQEAIYQWLKNK